MEGINVNDIESQIETLLKIRLSTLIMSWYGPLYVLCVYIASGSFYGKYGGWVLCHYRHYNNSSMSAGDLLYVNSTHPGEYTHKKSYFECDLYDGGSGEEGGGGIEGGDGTDSVVLIEERRRRSWTSCTSVTTTSGNTTRWKSIIIIYIKEKELL